MGCLLTCLPNELLYVLLYIINIVCFAVHVVCQVDIIAYSLVLYLQLCSTLNETFLCFFFLNIKIKSHKSKVSPYRVNCRKLDKCLPKDLNDKIKIRQ